jgi:hypothetical protein
MQTRLQCLEKAAHCARLAQVTDTPGNEHLLLEMAKQWRCLPDASRPTVRIAENGGKLAPRNEPLKARLLSQSAL